MCWAITTLSIQASEQPSEMGLFFSPFYTLGDWGTQNLHECPQPEERPAGPPETSENEWTQGELHPVCWPSLQVLVEVSSFSQIHTHTHIHTHTKTSVWQALWLQRKVAHYKPTVPFFSFLQGRDIIKAILNEKVEKEQVYSRAVLENPQYEAA